MNSEDLKIDIDQESLHIFFTDDEGENILSICYWHIDEVEEDSSVCISMLNAVQLYYTDRQKLIDILKY
jgi:hypothetical protein